MMRVTVRRIGSTVFELPKYETPGSVGLDLRAAIEAPLTLEPGARMLVPSGLAIAIPRGYEGQVRARSGLALKHGIWLPNAPGTIDSDYRGEIGVILANSGDAPFEVTPGIRIAQLVICPVTQVRLLEVEILDETDRGGGGFGHTS